MKYIRIKNIQIFRSAMLISPNKWVVGLFLCYLIFLDFHISFKNFWLCFKNTYFIKSYENLNCMILIFPLYQFFLILKWWLFSLIIILIWLEKWNRNQNQNKCLSIWLPFNILLLLFIFSFLGFLHFILDCFVLFFNL